MDEKRISRRRNLILDSILNASDSEIFQRVAPQLRRMGGSPELFESMETEDLARVRSQIRNERETMLRALKANEIGTNQRYARLVVEDSVVSAAIGSKMASEAKRKLVPGMTYYRKVTSGGNSISGERCRYLGEGRLPPRWFAFESDVRVEKAFALLEHGSDADFAKIYFIMADGSRFGHRKPMLEHVSGSSDGALDRIAAYCDARWEGEWPWQAPTPRRLKNLIEGRKMDKNAAIALMRRSIKSLMEGETEKAEVLVTGKDISTKIGGMISDLAKVSADLMADYKTMVSTEFGKEAVSGLDSIYGTGIETAMNGLSHLKDSIDDFLGGLENGGANASSVPLASGSDEIAPPGGDPSLGDSEMDDEGMPPEGDEGEGLEDFDISDLDEPNERKKKA